MHRHILAHEDTKHTHTHTHTHTQLYASVRIHAYNVLTTVHTHTLRCNMLTIIPDGISACVNLTALDLRNNDIDDIKPHALLALGHLA